MGKRSLEQKAKTAVDRAIKSKVRNDDYGREAVIACGMAANDAIKEARFVAARAARLSAVANLWAGTPENEENWRKAIDYWRNINNGLGVEKWEQPKAEEKET